MTYLDALEAASRTVREEMAGDRPVSVPDLAPPAAPLPRGLEQRRAEVTAGLTAVTETMTTRLGELRGRLHALSRLSARTGAARPGDLGRSLDLFG